MNEQNCHTSWSHIHKCARCESNIQSADEKRSPIGQVIIAIGKVPLEPTIQLQKDMLAIMALSGQSICPSCVKVRVGKYILSILIPL